MKVIQDLNFNHFQVSDPTILLSLEIPAAHRAGCGRWPEWWNPTRQMHAVRFGKLRSDAEAVLFP